MRLRCNIPETDNIVRVGNATYKFVRDEDGVLTADVPEDVADELMRRDEAFQAYDGSAILQAVAADADDPTKDEPVPEGGALAEAAAVYADKVIDELRTMYSERFGRQPSPLMKHETLVERLARDDLAKHG